MRHTEIRISPGFWLLLAWFGMANGWRPLLMLFGAAAIHELGHYAVLKAAGAEIRGLRIGIPGAVMEADRSGLSYGAELAAVLAGPGVNLLCAMLLLRLDQDCWTAAAGAHLVLCLFNLLPIRPLDGGKALELLLSWIWGPTAGERGAVWCGRLAGGTLACAAILVIAQSGGSFWLLPAVCGLLLAARTEKRRNL